MPHSILAIDVGAHAVKFAEFEVGFRQLRFVDFHQALVPPGDAPVAERATAALRELLAEKAESTSTLYAALSGDACSSRILNLPFSDPRRIEQVLGFELESQILQDIEEMVWDHTVVQSTPDGGARLLAVTARKADVQAALDAQSASNMEPRSLFAAPLAYGALADRALPNSTSLTAIVDIGAEHTNVCLVQGGRALWGRTIAQGGAHMTRALAKAYRIAEKDAEQAKVRDVAVYTKSNIPANPQQQHLAKVVHEALAPLLRELRQTLAAGRTALGTPVERIFACGGGSQLSGLLEYLADEISLPVEPFAKLLGALPNDTLGLERVPAEMVLPLAIGLAGATGRREIDFRRGPFAYRVDFSFLRAKAAYFAVCGVVVLFAAALNAYAALSQLRTERIALDKQLHTETTTLFGQALDDPQAVSDRIRKGIKMEELPVPTESAYDLLDEISRNMPAADKVKLDITELAIEPKKAYIKGTIDTASAVDDIRAGLAKINCFTGDKAIQPGPITNVGVGNQNLSQFTMQITSKCP